MPGPCPLSPPVPTHLFEPHIGGERLVHLFLQRQWGAQRCHNYPQDPPPNSNQPFWGAASPPARWRVLSAGAHQRDEVGEGEGQVDVHDLVGGDDGAQILVVAPLLEEVVDEPLLLVNAEPAWGVRGQAEP